MWEHVCSDTLDVLWHIHDIYVGAEMDYQFNLRVQPYTCMSHFLSYCSAVFSSEFNLVITPWWMMNAVLSHRALGEGNQPGAQTPTWWGAACFLQPHKFDSGLFVVRRMWCNLLSKMPAGSARSSCTPQAYDPSTAHSLGVTSTVFRQHLEWQKITKNIQILHISTILRVIVLHILYHCILLCNMILQCCLI